MADKAETGGAPTTKQTLIVALALGVVAGGGGGFLGYILGGRVAPVDKNATAETQEAGADKKEIEPKAAEASAAAADHGPDKHGANTPMLLHMAKRTEKPMATSSKAPLLILRR